MKRFILTIACILPLIATAQFTVNTTAVEQIGIRSGATEWWSNFADNPSGLGVAGELFYRRERKRLAIELSANYSRYSRPLHYYSTYLDGSGMKAYDKETLNSYAIIIGLQYRLAGSDNFSNYLGVFTNPVYYYYSIHALPGSVENPSSGAIKMGGGINYTAEYKLNGHLLLNAVLRCGYLKPRSGTDGDGIYTSPEFQTSVLLGCSYAL